MFAYSSDFAGPFTFVFSILSAIVLIAAWVILAASRFVQGGVMERPERVPQLYGYTVCLVALLWGIGSLLSLVQNMQSLSAPELRRLETFGFEPSVTSFEAFRATYDQSRRFGMADPNAKVETTPEPELRRRYEALRDDRIHRARLEARQELVRDILSLVIALLLFVFHWRWLKRRAGPLPVPLDPRTGRPAGSTELVS